MPAGLADGAGFSSLHGHLNILFQLSHRFILGCQPVVKLASDISVQSCQHWSALRVLAWSTPATPVPLTPCSAREHSNG